DLQADAGRTGDADKGVRVGGVHLLDVPAGDQVTHGRAPVAGHHHAVRAADRHDRGGVRDGLAPRAAGHDRALRERPVARQQVRRGPAQEVGERRLARDAVRRGQVAGQVESCVATPVEVAHWPPFCTYPRTNSSAFSSNTESISSSRSSTSSLSFSWRSATSGSTAGAVSSSTSLSRPDRPPCRWPPVSRAALETSPTRGVTV